jgi:hypothetical protein
MDFKKEEKLLLCSSNIKIEFIFKGEHSFEGYTNDKLSELIFIKGNHKYLRDL